MRQIHSRREVAGALLGAAGMGAAISLGGGTAATRASKRVQVDARPEPVAIDLSKTAVLVIDMQNDFGAKGGMFDRAGIDIQGIQAVVPAVRSVIAASRTVGLPIVYLKMGFKPDLSDAGPRTGPNLIKHGPMHVGDEAAAPDGRPSRILVRDTWNTEILAELRPEPSDHVLYKTRFSGFFNTGLQDLLAQRAIDTLILTGCTTSVCVESTVRDAMFRDYRCIVMEDCTAEPIGANEARTNHEASLLTMQILFAWISDSKRWNSALMSV